MMAPNKVAVALSCVLTAIIGLANTPSILSGATLEPALSRYFERPSNKTARAVLAAIPAEGELVLSHDDAGGRVRELLDSNTDQLCERIAAREVHALLVGLALQRFPYDHHVQNMVAMSLANIAASEPDILIKQAKRVKISPKEFAGVMSCAGLCGYDGNAEEQLEKRLASLQQHCQKHASPYCAASIAAIETTLVDVKKSP